MIERHWDGIAAYCDPENKVSLASWKDSTTRSASSNAAGRDCATRNTCDSRFSRACCLDCETRALSNTAFIDPKRCSNIEL